MNKVKIFEIIEDAIGCHYCNNDDIKSELGKSTKDWVLVTDEELALLQRAYYRTQYLIVTDVDVFEDKQVDSAQFVKELISKERNRMAQEEKEIRAREKEKELQRAKSKEKEAERLRARLAKLEGK